MVCIFSLFHRTPPTRCSRLIEAISSRSRAVTMLLPIPGWSPIRENVFHSTTWQAYLALHICERLHPKRPSMDLSAVDCGHSIQRCSLTTTSRQQQCAKWAHEACTDGYSYFTCPNCESD